MDWPNLNACSSQQHDDIFSEIFQAKPKLEKYLKEKCKEERKQKFSFMYFVKLFFFPKLLSKFLDLDISLYKNSKAWTG